MLCCAVSYWREEGETKRGKVIIVQHSSDKILVLSSISFDPFIDTSCSYFSIMKNFFQKKTSSGTKTTSTTRVKKKKDVSTPTTTAIATNVPLRHQEQPRGSSLSSSPSSVLNPKRLLCFSSDTTNKQQHNRSQHDLDDVGGDDTTKSHQHHRYNDVPFRTTTEDNAVEMIKNVPSRVSKFDKYIPNLVSNMTEDSNNSRTSRITVYENAVGKYRIKEEGPRPMTELLRRSIASSRSSAESCTKRSNSSTNNHDSPICSNSTIRHHQSISSRRSNDDEYRDDYRDDYNQHHLKVLSTNDSSATMNTTTDISNNNNKNTLHTSMSNPRQYPVLLTTDSAHVLAAISTDQSDCSVMDVPVRRFAEYNTKKTKNNSYISNSASVTRTTTTMTMTTTTKPPASLVGRRKNNPKNHQHQHPHSLLDDMSTVQGSVCSTPATATKNSKKDRDGGIDRRRDGKNRKHRVVAVKHIEYSNNNTNSTDDDNTDNHSVISSLTAAVGIDEEEVDDNNTHEGVVLSPRGTNFQQYALNRKREQLEEELYIGDFAGCMSTEFIVPSSSSPVAVDPYRRNPPEKHHQQQRSNNNNSRSSIIKHHHPRRLGTITEHRLDQNEEDDSSVSSSSVVSKSSIRVRRSYHSSFDDNSSSSSHSRSSTTDDDTDDDYSTSEDDDSSCSITSKKNTSIAAAIRDDGSGGKDGSRTHKSTKQQISTMVQNGATKRAAAAGRDRNVDDDDDRSFSDYLLGFLFSDRENDDDDNDADDLTKEDYRKQYDRRDDTGVVHGDLRTSTKDNAVEMMTELKPSKKSTKKSKTNNSQKSRITVYDNVVVDKYSTKEQARTELKPSKKSTKKSKANPWLSRTKWKKLGDAAILRANEREQRMTTTN